jgi:D-glucuronyl C5-epimerase C-terminus
VSLVSYPESQPLSPWYVERAYPGANPWKGAALNGFMVTLLDLERTSEVMGRPKLPPPRPEAAYDSPPIEVAQAKNLARRLVDEGLVSLKRYIPAHDTGEWSLYGLLTPGYRWREKVADLNYHCYHITLLRKLDADFPGQTFAHFAVRWQGYVRKQGLECPGSTPLPTANSESKG